MSACALIIFAKEPIPGQVKTRLARSLREAHPTLSEADSLELSKFCFEQFCLELASKDYGSLDIYLYYASSDEPQFLVSCFGSHAKLKPQIAGDLGDKMAQAMREQFDSGYSKILCIGTDSPHLPLESIQAGFEYLNEVDCVIGPTEDGGYYTIGLRAEAFQDLEAFIFRDIPWSTERVCELTRQRLDQQGASHQLLPNFYDIDEYDELKRYLKICPSNLIQDKIQSYL